jgi:hypothetical protein
LSHPAVQQKASKVSAQILLVHASHSGKSGAPSTHSECVQPKPQRPPLQAWLQHSLGVVHGMPSGAHVNGPHWPSWLQGPLQQGGPLAMQTVPSGWQVGGPQIPFEQRLLQQGALGEQGTPSGLHIGAPQMLFGPHVPAQQSIDVVQGLPSSWHVGEPPDPPWPPEPPEAPVPLEAAEAPVPLEAPDAPVPLEAPEAPVPPEAPEAPVWLESPKPRSLRPPQLAMAKGRPRSVIRASVLSPKFGE